MLSVKAIYDGKKLKLLDKVKVTKPHKVIITFLEDDSDINPQLIYNTAEEGGAYDFLKEPEEDIYTDDDLKKRYR
ncbi:hypothetical protein KJ656_11805 [bacterium]|nr:hypothetical protein [bacterium]